MRKGLSIFLCMAIMAVFGGCNISDPASAGGAEETPERVSASTEEAGGTDASGKVVVYMPSPAGLADKLAAGFEAKTGVKVEQFQGTTGEILARLETEQANPVADIVVLASWADGLALKENGQTLSYTPAGAQNLMWVDSDSSLFGVSASAVGVIYNTTLVPQLDADWEQLADEQYRDLLAIPDPEKSGSCKDFLSGYINVKGEAGWSIWEALAEYGMTVPGANAAALESVATGEKGILVSGVDYNAYSNIAKGEPLAIYYPQGGTVINPRPAMILSTSPNVENARLFIDYLLSDEAQALVAEAYLLPGRSDVTYDNRATVSDIPAMDVDWAWMMEHSEEIAARLMALCG